MPAWRHNLCALRLVERQLTSFPLRHWNVRNLTLQQECYFTSTRAFFRTFAWLYNAAASPASRLCSAGSLAIMYTMCPPGCYHNGFMATPELGHRMYGYTLLDCIVESEECSKCKVVSEAICQKWTPATRLSTQSKECSNCMNSEHNYK